MTTKKKNNIDSEKEKLYIQIANHCDWLRIARYLKNEAKNALKYFHAHKLSNIKKNLNEFSEYLLYLNDQNCQKINWFSAWKESKRTLNNSVSYFYDYEKISDKELPLIQAKIETNTYETITLMQSIKWCLILTIDEFCNASPTRIDIMRYELWKKKAKQKKKSNKQKFF
jgi:hypothetical protein